MLLQVKYLEAVDIMLRQLIRCLHQAELNDPQGRRYSVCLTGDHATPAVFGDHSHEPVPFAVAHLRHMVRFCTIVTSVQSAVDICRT